MPTTRSTGWMGDDWFHNGAFRQSNFNWFAQNTSVKGKGDSIAPYGKDDYASSLEAGSAGDYARKYGIDQIPWWERLTAHPSYDALWKDQALDKKSLVTITCPATTMSLSRHQRCLGYAA